MPRVESTKVSSGAGTHSPYHLAYDSANAASTSTSPSRSSSSASISIVSPPPRPASSSSSTPTSSPLKKRHVCPTCERGFTTSGHLARHVRIHTGERNHACPFPGCETRCSRQDNLQQHYRIHLSPGSRRATGRNGSTRRRARTVMPPPSTGSSSSSSSSHSGSASGSPSASASPSLEHLASPPPLAPATLYHDRTNSLSDTPPPLSTATGSMAGYSSVATTAYSSRQHSPSGRESASPEPCYASPHLMSFDGHGLDSQYATVGPSYRQQASAYGNEQAHTSSYGYTNSPATSYQQSYAHQTPPMMYQTPQAVSHLSASSTSLHQVHTRNSTPQMPPLSSRHSISHISHPLPQTHHQQYAAHSGASTLNPPSPASSHHSLATSSLASGPSTPTFPMYGGSFSTESSLADANSSSAPNSYFHQGPHVVSSNGYAMSASTPVSADSATSRFPSPPPVLAPIHSVHTQNVRRASMPVLERHCSAPTISMGHQQTAYSDVSQVYEYERQTYGIKQGYDMKQDAGYGRHDGYGGYRDMSALSHGAWKGRGVGALVG